jgi:hypothetical protein
VLDPEAATQAEKQLLRARPAPGKAAAAAARPGPFAPLEAEPRRMELWAAAFSILAGAIHGGVAPAHFSEWWAYGLFFATAAAAQGIFGLLLITRGLERTEPKGSGWPEVRATVYLAGIAGNLLIMAMWVLSRTVGVPLGPESGEVEEVGPVDALSKVFEAVLVALLLVLLLRARRRRGSVVLGG